MKFKLDVTLAKKHKYFIYSLLISVLMILFSYGKLGSNVTAFSLILFFVCCGTAVTQYPNIDLKNILMALLLPLHLVIGTMLSLIYFPNLSIVFKLGALIGFGSVFYVISLVNNVFLVVEDRNELIPLYRVATTWSHILLVVVAIPYFAGIFKLSLNTFIQSFIICLSVFSFSLYFMWILRFDADAKKPKIGETLMLSLFASFCVYVLSVGFSFIPTESFLRALFVSAVLMFCINYQHNHLKNSITKKIVIEYIIVCFVFLLILLIFNP